MRDFILAAFAILFPAAAIFLLHNRAQTDPQLPSALYSGGSVFPPSRLAFERRSIGNESKFPPRICNVQILDFDGDGRSDVLCCDARRNTVLIYLQTESGTWEEQVLASDLVAPAHAEVSDLDGDGDRDVVVAVLGNIRPDDGVVGSVVWLEQISPTEFRPHVILTDVRRVADAQAGDLDGDGDMDLAIAVFGYARGQILWLENRGGGKFREHQLMYVPGTIHVPLADYDGDGDLDIAATVTQNEEELWAFENDGKGGFEPHRLWFTHNFDIGGAGLVKSDVDADGDIDLLLAVGDNLEYEHTYPQPYHGCIWFENQGGWKFAPHRISSFGGTYAVAAGDLDHDGDRDVVLVSMFNEWDRDGVASIVWLENDGEQNFTTWQIDDRPIRLATVACGDLNNDGHDDIVAGGLQMVTGGGHSSPIDAWLVSDQVDK